MLKKTVLCALSALLLLSLCACGGTGQTMANLTVPGNGQGVVSAASQTSQPEGSQPASSEAKTEGVKMEDCEDNLEGLCKYLEGNYAVAGDKEEMSFQEIGAKGGYRYRFTYSGRVVQVEVYEYDLQNLDEKGKEFLDSGKTKGRITVLGNEVPVTLSANGKYMMIYTNDKPKEEQKAQQERVEELFSGFKADS